MKKYALIKGTVVHSVFETDKDISEMPDIAPYLKEITGQDIKCNDLCYRDLFYKAPEPIEIETKDGEREAIVPTVNFVDKSFSWPQFAATIAAVAAGLAAQYFLK